MTTLSATNEETIKLHLNDIHEDALPLSIFLRYLYLSIFSRDYLSNSKEYKDAINQMISSSDPKIKEFTKYTTTQFNIHASNNEIFIHDLDVLLYRTGLKTKLDDGFLYILYTCLCPKYLDKLATISKLTFELPDSIVGKFHTCEKSHRANITLMNKDISNLRLAELSPNWRWLMLAAISLPSSTQSQKETIEEIISLVVKTAAPVKLTAYLDSDDIVRLGGFNLIYALNAQNSYSSEFISKQHNTNSFIIVDEKKMTTTLLTICKKLNFSETELDNYGLPKCFRNVLTPITTTVPSLEKKEDGDVETKETNEEEKTEEKKPKETEQVEEPEENNEEEAVVDTEEPDEVNSDSADSAEDEVASDDSDPEYGESDDNNIELDDEPTVSPFDEQGGALSTFTYRQQVYRTLENLKQENDADPNKIRLLQIFCLHWLNLVTVDETESFLKYEKISLLQ